MIALLLTRMSLAQDVLLEDFDPPALTWTDTTSAASGTGIPYGDFYVLDSAYYGVPWDGDAGICHTYSSPRGNGQCEGTSSAVVVTHPTLALQLGFWEDNVASFYAHRVGTDALVDIDDYTAFPGWAASSLDTASACGREVYFRMEGYDSGYGAAYWVDDLTWTGAVCPQFQDQDADGLCPQGTDLDGDGTCVDPGEVAGAQVVLDCDDAAPGTDCLSLVAEQPVRGGAMRVQVTGAAPYERVGLVIGQTAGTSCPAALGGRCFELSASGADWRAVRADATGAVDVSIPVPSTLAYRSEVRVQAAVVRGPGGVDSRLSNLSVDVVH